MATKIKIKQSAVVGKIPLATDLVQGELALNTADKLLYSKDSAGAIFSIGGGSSSGLNAAKSEITEFTPTVNQTTFTVPGGYNLPAGHVITVWYNGVRLADADYTATNGTTFVLTTGATYTTDIITVEKQYVESIYGGSEIVTDEYTVTAATQTTFASIYEPNKSFVEVFVNGIKLLEDDYTKTSGTNIVLDVAAVLGDDVVIKVIKILTIATDANADWTQTTTTDPEYIQNKPFNTIGSGLSVTSGVLNASAYSLPTASSTILGGVKVGTNLSISSGVLSSTDTNTQLTDAQIGAMGYIKIDTNTQVTVNNTLTSTSTTEALSAKQGKILNDGKVANSRVLTDVPINAVFTDTTYASSDFNHDQLAGFVANEHIDWTANQSSSIHFGNLPALALTTVQTAANQTAHLALTTQEGDVVVRSDENKTYIRNAGTAGTMADFTLLATPTDAVLSVDGATGAVVLNHDTLAGFVANEHIDWTTDQGATNIHAGNYTDTDTTYSDGTGITLTGTVFSTTAEPNVQSDWSQATTTSDDYIKNKPNVQYTSAIPNATTSASGLMASGDKTKLDGIATSANLYVHPTTAGNKHIPTGGASNQYLKYSASGTAVWANIAADTNTTYTHKVSTQTDGAGIDLDPSTGSTDIIKITGSGSTTVTRVDADTINITSTDDSIAMAIALG